MKKKFPFFPLIIILNIHKLYSYVVFPLKTLSKDNYVFSKKNNEKSIVKKMFYSDVYTVFEIGNSQNVPMFLSVTQSIFQITSLLSGGHPDEPEVYNLTSLFKNNGKLGFFDEDKSPSFKYNEEIKSEDKKICLGNDTIAFYNNLELNNPQYLNFNFELLLKFQKENISGEIGLAFPDKDSDNYKLLQKSNLLYQFKENKLINNYNWFMLYDKWDNVDGRLVLGAAPHDLFPKKYSKDDLIFANSIFDASTGHNWKIKFRDISLGDFHLNNLTTELIFDSEVIIGPREVDNLLLNLFLQDELKNKNCFQGSFYQKAHYITTLKYYYCDIRLKDVIYEALPNINMNSREFNFTFEINKDDLLYTEGNYVFFKLLFFIEENNIWLLGKPFSLKYQFVFNPDSKQIGIYNPDYIPEETGQNSIKKKVWLVLIIILLCVIFTVLGVIIGKKIYGLRRKQKANELVDDFEYLSASEIKRKGNKDNTIAGNNRINNFSINAPVSNYKSIEMNTKLY